MRAGVLLLAAGLAAGVGACGGGDGAPSDPPRAAPGASTPAARADSPHVGPEADAGRTGDVVETDEGADSVAGGDPRPLRSRLLRLVNSRAEAVVVYASAGREAVVLDSLAAGDSSEVKVESRAPRVGLRALAGGRPVAADSLDLTATEPARWSVPSGAPSATPPADSAAGVTGGRVSSRPAPGRR